MSWNPVLNLIIKIKQDYYQTFNNYGDYKLESWIKELNKSEYNDIFDCLQINQHNSFVLIRYGLHDMAEGMWNDPNSIYRECRSVVIDIEKECIVIAALKKFFNVNETNENKIEILEKKISKAKVLEFTNKLDGSMQCARWYDNRVIMVGSMALDSKSSWRLEDGLKRLTDGHMNMLQENPNLTFIFEYISLQDGHVVIYNKQDEGLYLIGIRDVESGRQFNYSEVKEFSEKYNVNMTQIEDITFEEVLKKMKEYKSNEKEGWVLNIDGGLVKIKCDDYVHLHRLLDKVSSINVIIENIAEDRIDDLMSKIPDNYKDRIRKVENMIITYRNDILKLINKYYELAPKEDKKEFMLWIDKNVPENIRGYVRCVYLKRDFNVLKKGNNGYKKMSDMGFDTNYSAIFADIEEDKNE